MHFTRTHSLSEVLFHVSCKNRSSSSAYIKTFAVYIKAFSKSGHADIQTFFMCLPRHRSCKCAKRRPDLWACFLAFAAGYHLFCVFAVQAHKSLYSWLERYYRYLTGLSLSYSQHQTHGMFSSSLWEKCYDLCDPHLFKPGICLILYSGTW